MNIEFNLKGKRGLLLIVCLCMLISNATANSPNIKRLTGVNWFGFETSNYIPHGLWSRDYKSMLKQMKDLGFNCIRLPWSNEMLDKSPNGITISQWVTDNYTKIKGMNTDLEGLTSLEIMDKIIIEAEIQGLRIILDCHSRSANGYYNETLWYTNTFSEQQWIDDWVFIINRYKNSNAVVAVDLNNEPHGGLYGQGMKPPASWGYDVPGHGITNWKRAAETCATAVLAVDPDVIIVLQGVQETSNGSNYWWGSNHADLKKYPVTSIPGSRILYSVHEYGPSVANQVWFDDPTFPANLPSIWNDRFWFIYQQDLGGLYIGEMGLKEDEANNPFSIAYQWFTTWLEFAGRKVNWTYWCWNPNSGDTGGILQDDWLTVNPTKYNMIKPYLEPWDTTPTSTPQTTATPTPVQTATPTSTPVQGAGNVRLNPVNTSIVVGGTITETLIVNSGNQNIGSYNFDITYNAGLISVRNVLAGGAGPEPIVNTNTSGVITIAGFTSTGSGPGNNLELVKITWDGIAGGTSPIGVVVNILKDTASQTVGSPNGQGGSITVIGSVTPTPTPTSTPTPTPSPQSGGYTFWIEDFGDLMNGTSVDNGITSWTATNSSTTSTSNWWSSNYTKYFGVYYGEFRGRSITGEGVLATNPISISGYTDVALAVDLREIGNLNEADYISISYSLDWNQEVNIAYLTGNFSRTTVEIGGLNGSTLQIFIRMHNSNRDKNYYIDNLRVTGL